MSENSRFTFVAEYQDQQAAQLRKYQFLYYVEDSSVEMYDLKNKRMFLKRCPYPQLSTKELFIGSTITVYSRQLKLVEYGDEATRRAFASQTTSAVIVIGSNAIGETGNIIDFLTACNHRITNCQLCVLPKQTAADLQLSERCFALDVTGGDIANLENVLKDKFPSVTTFTDEKTQLVRVATFESPMTTATLNSCAVCVIKPHAIVAGQAGKIIQRIIDEGFEITAFGLFSLSLTDAEDFLEVYKGVVPEYKKLIEHVISGPVMAFEVRAENSVGALRAVCGPHDPEICRVLFPNTIRAHFGIDRVRNAVHCTDLEEDGPLESEFFFSLLRNKA